MRRAYPLSTFASFACFSAVLGLGCSGPGRGSSDAGELQGVLRVGIASYADHSEANFRLELGDGRTVALMFATPPRVNPGESVVVRGTLEAGRLEVESLEALPRAPAKPLVFSSAQPTTLKTAYLSFDSGYSAEEGRTRLLDDIDGPKSFYSQNSWGAWIIEGDAYGPYSLGVSGCQDLPAIASAAETLASDAGVDLKTFDNVMYYLPSTQGCSWGGWGDMGVVPATRTGFKNGRHAYYNSSDDCVVFNQELGHTYGLGHSHFCSGGPPYVIQQFDGPNGMACSGHQEYGDPFTPMAQGCGHLNAAEKGEMAFIHGCNTLLLTDSGSFEISPIEVQTDGPQVLRVPNGDVNNGPQYIYVEYRKDRVPGDSVSVPGILFHAGPDYDAQLSGSTDPDWIYSTDPIIVASGSADNVLTEGEWTEPSTGVTFKVVALADTAKIDVTFPQGDGQAATCYGSGGAGGAGGAGGSSGSGGAGASGGAGGAGGSDAGTGGGGAGGTGGSSGSAGGGSGGTGGLGVGGTSGTGGTTGGAAGSSGGAGAGAGTAGMGSGGTDSGTSDGADEGGCACSVPSGLRAPNGVLVALGVALLAALRRRHS